MTPSSVEQLGALAEEGVVEADADMLEHADRDDAVEAAVDVAIVLQLEVDRCGQAASRRARSRRDLHAAPPTA